VFHLAISNQLLISEVKLMRLWKKGAIIGGIWGILSIIPYSYINMFDPLYKKILLTMIGLPTYIALIMQFHFIFVFIGALIVGVIVGGGTGYLIEKRYI